MITGGQQSNSGYVISLAGDIVAKMDNFASPLTTSSLSPDDEVLILGTHLGKVYFYENYIQMVN
jgi:hypothetical protein